MPSASWRARPLNILIRQNWYHGGDARTLAAAIIELLGKDCTKEAKDPAAGVAAARSVGGQLDRLIEVGQHLADSSDDSLLVRAIPQLARELIIQI
jgi:hypothetical protein